MEAINIATSYKLAEGIDHLPRSETFMTLKETNTTFTTNHHAAWLP